MNENREPDVTEKKPAEPLPVDPDDRWDWEFYQPPPPPLRRWKVQGRIVWKGPAQPLPHPDPDEGETE